MVNSKCPNCLKIIKNEQCEFCDCINYNVEPGRSIPEEIKKKVIENTFKKPIREELDENELELLLKDSLKMCKYKSDYNFIKTNKKRNLVAIKPTENGFDLYYNPSLLRTLNDDEIKAALRHEIFHPITAGVVKFPKKEEFTNQQLFRNIYFEMINHKKHINEIPNDIEFRKLKQNISYEPIQTLLIVKNSVNQYIPNGYTSQVVLMALFTVLEFLIYYFYDDRKRINLLIKKYNLQAIWEFFSWINQDMSYIQQNSSNMDEILAYIDKIYMLSSNVNIKKILLENKIGFNEKFKMNLENALPIEKNKIAKKLLEFWEERILENGLN